MGITRALCGLRGFSRRVRSAKQIPYGPAVVDESSLLAFVALADLRLQPGTDGCVLRMQERLRTVAHSVESRNRDDRGSKLQRRRRPRAFGGGGSTQHGWDDQVEEILVARSCRGQRFHLFPDRVSGGSHAGAFYPADAVEGGNSDINQSYMRGAQEGNYRAIRQ